MRRGSTSPGSLGQIVMLMLPLPIAAAAVLGFRSVRAAADSPAEEKVEVTEREVLEKRSQSLRWPTWVQSRGTAPAKPVAKPAAKPAAGSAAEKARVLKVIHTRATWYGPGFHGRRTASGERFNRHAMTLASRHLPFGTRVRVTNPKTGKSAIARVNDRGPFRGGYTADLSQGLAQRIGLRGSGPVKLEILAREKKK
jgi:peptidoglycan lytic transglycosylase